MLTVRVLVRFIKQNRKTLEEKTKHLLKTIIIFSELVWTIEKNFKLRIKK